jgi:hypothetical protein
MPCKDPRKRREYDRAYRAANIERIRDRDRVYDLLNPKRWGNQATKRTIALQLFVELFGKRPDIKGHDKIKALREFLRVEYGLDLNTMLNEKLAEMQREAA